MVNSIKGATTAHQVTPGHFCWVDLGAANQSLARAFYEAVMGWSAKTLPLPDGGDYTLLKASGKEAAGLYALSDDQRTQRVPSHWLPYIAVEDADMSVDRAKSLGATILVAAYDVLELGRMAMLIDPTGALFAIWEAKSHSGFKTTAAEAGAFCWSELMTNDLERAVAFYSELFGWQADVRAKDGMRHGRFRLNGVDVADVMSVGSGQIRIPAHWLSYFAVPSCEMATTLALSRGARSMLGPAVLPTGEAFSVLRDPQGALFGLMETELG